MEESENGFKSTTEYQSYLVEEQRHQGMEGGHTVFYRYKKFSGLELARWLSVGGGAGSIPPRTKADDLSSIPGNHIKREVKN